MMTSTLQLTVGNKASHGLITTGWLKYNNQPGYCVHTSQNIQSPIARFFLVCYSAPIKKVKDRKEAVLLGPNRDKMEIVSVDLVHSCERNTKRKRNYLTKEIQNVSDVLKVYQPAKYGNTRQFKEMTKAATEVTIKNSHAYVAICGKTNKTCAIEINSRFVRRPSQSVNARKNFFCIKK
jgi:uncharacterized membrane protein